MNYKNLMIALVILTLTSPALLWAQTNEDDQDKDTESIIDDLEKEFDELNEIDKKKKENKIGEEGLKPVTEVDAEKLLDEILKRMDKSEVDMLSSNGENAESGLQEEIIQGLNRIHGLLIRDLNKLIDVIKMTQSSEKSEQSEQQKKKQKQGEAEGQKNQQTITRPNASSPAVRPYTPNGSDFLDDLDRIEAKGEKWGFLPDKVIDDIKHARTEGVIPKYDNSIKEYMKRLNTKEE